MATEQSSALIEPNSDEQIIWRYLSYPKLLSMLNTEELRFTRADRFTDPLEGYLSLKALLEWSEQSQLENQETAKAWGWGDEIDLVKGMMEKNPVEVIKQQRKQAFVSCWTSEGGEVLDLWKDYTPAGRGVVIKSTVGQLKKAIKDIKLKNLSIGEVHYTDFKKDHGPTLKNYSRYPFAYKDRDFSNERELRVIIFEKGYDEEEYKFLKCQDIVTNKAEYEDYRRSSTPFSTDFIDNYQEKPVTIGVDLEKLIEEIRISPYSRGWQKSVLESVVCELFELSIPVQESSLDVELEDQKTSVDTTPSELYSKILEQDFLTIEDLANFDYDIS